MSKAPELPGAVRALAVPLGLLAFLHAAMCLAILVRVAGRERIQSVLVASIVAWLVLGAFRLIEIVVTLAATDNVFAPRDAALISLGLAVVAMGGAPTWAWLRRPSAQRTSRRFSRGSFALLGALVAFRLVYVFLAAHGKPPRGTPSATGLGSLLSVDDLFASLPAPERGRVAALNQLEAVECPRRQEEGPTAIVTYLTRAGAVAPTRSVCLQEDSLEALASSLRAQLARSASRGPLRLDLVVRVAELPSSKLLAEWSMSGRTSGLCTEVSCLMPWQLSARRASSDRAAGRSGPRFELGPDLDQLLASLEPKRHGGRALRFWRVEVESLGVTPDGMITKLEPERAWPARLATSERGSMSPIQRRDTR